MNALSEPIGPDASEVAGTNSSFISCDFDFVAGIFSSASSPYVYDER
jgi:hypothetical protein